MLPLVCRALPESERNGLPLSKYRPIYFLYGVPTSKVQFSFKYQTIESIPLFIGYTQLMFWELLSESVPFRDINYNPEVFYRFKLDEKSLTSIDAGYEHLSNGRDKDSSRSIHRMYLELHLQTPDAKDHFELNAKVRQPIIRDSNASDYDRYAGGTVTVQAGITEVFSGVFDQGYAYARIAPGGRWLEELQYGSQEVGFSFRLGGLHLAPSIFIQYFHGYAESMLDYRVEEQNFRVGILL